MALSPAEAERAVFTARRGDDWRRTWTRTTGSRSYAPDSLVVQIRAGATEEHQLLASTANGAGYDGSEHALIDTAGTDLTADPPVIALAITGDHLLRVPAGTTHRIEIEALEDLGDGKTAPVTLLPSHPFVVEPQTAVRGSS